MGGSARRVVKEPRVRTNWVKQIDGEGEFGPLSRLEATGTAQAALHERAAVAAAARFGNRVFVRGVVEVSNHCRQNCSYCGMRRDNRELDRYRAKLDQLLELVVHHRPQSITDINLQAGEDPVAVREVVVPLVREIRRRTGLGVSVCLGNLDHRQYAALREAGATIYILKFETANEGRYAELGAPGSLAKRLADIGHLAEAGWWVSSGFIAGLPGEGVGDLARSLELAASLPIAGCSVSPFIPGDATPQAKSPMGSLELTLNCMAALRLIRPDWVIPAVSALNLAGPDRGYRRGLATGANLATINMTPTEMRGDYLLYSRDRIIMTEGRILAALEAEGKIPSSTGLAAHFETRATAVESLSAV